MAGKISDLTVAASVTAADQIEVLQGGVNKSATLAVLTTLLMGAPGAIGAVTPGSAALTTVTATSLALGGATIGARALAVTGPTRLDGALDFATDATHDIGAAAANRPKSMFLSGSMTIGTAGIYTCSGRGGWRMNADGVMRLINNAGSDFSYIQFGGTTSSFPALKKSSTILQSRLADDSAFAPLQGVLRTAVNAVTGLTAGVLSATTNASIVVQDASGQDYRIPCII